VAASGRKRKRIVGKRAAELSANFSWIWPSQKAISGYYRRTARLGARRRGAPIVKKFHKRGALA